MRMSDPRPLLAVDSPSMLFRAFYALPDSIKGADGKPVNALLGATNLILREVERFDPRAVVLCFGPDAADYRVELFPDYHAERPEVPEALAPQFADSDDFFGAFGWTVSNHDSLEADDLLGSYAALEEAAGGRALLLTGDRDLYQCASEQDNGALRAHRLQGRRGGDAGRGAKPLRNRARAGTRLHRPARRPLRRDPGGEGRRREDRRRLLREHGSLEQVLEHAIRMPRPALRTSLLDGREQLLAFKQIATLHDAKVRRPRDRRTDWSGAAKAARKRGMNRLADRLAKLG